MNTPNQSPRQFDWAAWRLVAARQETIRKIHVTWSRESVLEPHPMSDEEFAERVTTSVNAFSNRMPHKERRAVEAVQSFIDGFVGLATLDMVRIRSTRKATLSFDTSIADTNCTFKSHAIDFFDGSLVGHFDWSIPFSDGRLDAPEKGTWSGTIHPHENNLNRSAPEGERIPNSDPMNRTAPPGSDILLMQMLVSSVFSSSKDDWVMGDDHCVITTRGVDEYNWRLTISNTTGCPLRLEHLHRNSLKSFRTYEVTQTRFVDGIELPAEIVCYSPQNGSPDRYQEKYVLQSCRLNDDVGDSEINLPPDIVVRDVRLGDDKEVQYTLPDGKWLSDAEVESLLHRKQRERLWTRVALTGLPVLGTAALGTIYTLSRMKTRD